MFIALMLMALTAPTSAPLTGAGHMLAVEAKVNGKGPYRFTIDSGAAGPLRISADIAKALGLEQIGEVRAGDPSGKNVETRPLYRVESLEIGSTKLGPINATVAPNIGGPVAADGVIGLGVFPKMTVTLDYPKKELRISSAPLPATGEHVIPFTLDRGIPVIEVDAAGTKLKADVDTGSPAVLSIPTSWAAKLPLGEQKVVGHGRTSVNEFEIRAAELKGDLQVAGYSAPAARIDIVDLFPVANLGSRFLRDYAVTFDTANNRMMLEK